MAEGNGSLGNVNPKELDPSKVSPFVYSCAFLLSTFLTCFVSAWLAVSSDVKEFIASNKEIQILELKNKGDSDDNAEKFNDCISDLSLLRDELSLLTTKLATEKSALHETAKAATARASAAEQRLRLLSKPESKNSVGENK